MLENVILALSASNSRGFDQSVRLIFMHGLLLMDEFNVIFCWCIVFSVTSFLNRTAMISPGAYSVNGSTIRSSVRSSPVKARF